MGGLEAAEQQAEPHRTAEAAHPQAPFTQLNWPEHPQVTLVPQPFEKEPQTLPLQGFVGVQPQRPGPPPPHVCPVGQVQVIILPHPSLTGPHFPPVQAAACSSGVQPQTFGLGGVPLPHWLNPVQLPQRMPGHVPWTNVPQSSPAGQVVGHVLMH